MPKMPMSKSTIDAIRSRRGRKPAVTVLQNGKRIEYATYQDRVLDRPSRIVDLEDA